MKAVKYKVKAVRSVLERTHGMEWSISEIFIPEKGIIFNMADGDLHVFKGESERSNEGKEEIEVDDDLVKSLETYLKTKEEYQKRAKHLLSTARDKPFQTLTLDAPPSSQAAHSTTNHPTSSKTATKQETSSM